MTRVLIVDDSAIMRNMIAKIFKDSSSISLVGEAENGLKALTLAKKLKPDVIIMDISMPLMDGLEATKQIMKESPCAIVLFASQESLSLAYKALEYGAVEIIHKPDLSILTSSFGKEFLKKIDAIAQANTDFFNTLSKQRQESSQAQSLSQVKNNKKNYEIVGIAASTGGPLAIQKILQELSSDFLLPILIVQHIEKNFDTAFVNWLSQTSTLPVSLAEHKQIIQNGHVYIAPADYHMVVEKSKENNEFYILLNQEAEKHFLRPAADPLFFSLADSYKSSCISIVLTGMGSDGAESSLYLKNKGAYTIAESKESCVVFGMPKAAIDKGAICEVLPLSSIAKKIQVLAGCS